MQPLHQQKKKRLRITERPEIKYAHWLAHKSPPVKPVMRFVGDNVIARGANALASAAISGLELVERKPLENSDAGAEWEAHYVKMADGSCRRKRKSLMNDDPEIPKHWRREAEGETLKGFKEEVEREIRSNGPVSK